MITGALSLIETAVQAGVEICFANPGTTELPLVLALEKATGIRAVLGLFEGVCTGAADGWARMTGRPAATLLHLGPGLANGLANLHNARRARTPVVNWIGDHATHHLPFDAPLTSDIASLTDTVGWTRSIRSPQDMADASLDAIEAALGRPGRVASLIIPANCQWEPGPPALSVKPMPVLREASGLAVQEAARLLRGGGSRLFLGGNALTERGLRAAGRIAAATPCSVWTETFTSRQERGRHLPNFPSLPYFPEQACEALANAKNLVLAGAREPIAFFAYPNQPSRLAPPGANVYTLADPGTDIDATRALEMLAQELNAPIDGVTAPRHTEALSPTDQQLDPDNLGRVISAFTPENAIVVNEAATTGLFWSAMHAANAAPHTMLGLTGGAIGQGLPVALGAALACPERRVIAFQADGSGLYTLQALWSMARESTDVTIVVCANRQYRILQIELMKAVTIPGPKALALTELIRPPINWIDLAKGFGIPACRVHTNSELATALTRVLAEPGPSLIEALLI